MALDMIKKEFIVQAQLKTCKSAETTVKQKNRALDSSIRKDSTLPSFVGTTLVNGKGKGPRILLFSTEQFVEKQKNYTGRQD